MYQGMTMIGMIEMRSILFVITAALILILPTQLIYAGGNFFPEEGTKEFNDIKRCVDDGYEDGRNEPFSRDRYEECNNFDYLEVNPYYDAFINGCQDAGNLEEICERFTDS